ncbi:MAG: helix-turn-helix domain-containing protein [Phenylobacterium sp.]
MLRIGYLRLHEPDGSPEQASLAAAGCQVVRAEHPDACGSLLDSILEFIGEGDQLAVARLDQLGDGGRQILEVLDRLERRGASLYVLEPELCSLGAGGPALRAALEAVAAVDTGPRSRRRRLAATQEIRALQRAGVGPVEIARRLGVSRMTVWRKLKAATA